MPVEVFAVSVQPSGVVWAKAEVTSISAERVNIRYQGDPASLSRDKLFRSWAVWRGLIFVSSRTGRAAKRLDDLWWQDYGSRLGDNIPASMLMTLAQAVAILGVPANYSAADITYAFRRAAKKAHPDAGGSSEQFDLIVRARDRLLASLGEAAPKPPKFAPKGATVIYRKAFSRRGGAARLGATRRIAG